MLGTPASGAHTLLLSQSALLLHANQPDPLVVLHSVRLPGCNRVLLLLGCTCCQSGQAAQVTVRVMLPGCTCSQSWQPQVCAHWLPAQVWQAQWLLWFGGTLSEEGFLPTKEWPARSPCQVTLFGVGVQIVLAQAPQHREHEALQAV